MVMCRLDHGVNIDAAKYPSISRLVTCEAAGSRSYYLRLWNACNCLFGFDRSHFGILNGMGHERTERCYVT